VESWRRVFREGLEPVVSTPGLLALRQALLTDDPRLIQGATTTPPPLMCVQDWPVEAACMTAYCFWQGDGLETVAEVEEAFARACYEMDARLGEPAGCRWLLNAYDEWPREEMRRLLRYEVERALAIREGKDFPEEYPGEDERPCNLPTKKGGFGK
jgi:hypothetical protein